MKASIVGIGKYVPEKIVTNADLEKVLDTNDEWIKTRTGIEERRIATEEEKTSDLATKAALQALEDADMHPEDIDFILVATITSDSAFPSVACIVQKNLGAKRAVCMDVSAACSGFVYALVTASTYIETGLFKNILVIGAEKLSSIVDWNDRNTAVLFGDGAGAVVLKPTQKEDYGILTYDLGSDGNGGDYLKHDRFIQMNGREVFKLAVRQMGESCEKVLQKAELTKEDIALVIPHQANVRIMDSICERLKLQKEQMSSTIHRYGNTSAASIPIALADEYENGKIKDDSYIIFCGFGGGFTWGALLLRLEHLKKGGNDVGI